MCNLNEIITGSLLLWKKHPHHGNIFGIAVGNQSESEYVMGVLWSNGRFGQLVKLGADTWADIEIIER